jgi:hypothetical protein
MSWSKCEDAAKGTTSILQRYRQTFSLARAPYLIVSIYIPSLVCARPVANGDKSYVTFVAATIHVRIAAQRGSPSNSASLLDVCLEALKDNSATNPGVKKMYQSIMTLMTRLNVNQQQDGAGNSANAGGSNPMTEELDIDAIIRYVNFAYLAHDH